MLLGGSSTLQYIHIKFILLQYLRNLENSFQRTLAITLNFRTALVNKSGRYTIQWTKTPKLWSLLYCSHANHPGISAEKPSAI